MGAQMAIDEINAAGGILGRPVQLIFEDNQSKAGESATVARKLISRDAVVALLGEVSSGRSLEAAPVCQAARIPMISSGSNPRVTEVGSYIFRVNYIDPFQGTVMAKFAKEKLGAKRVALLTDVTNAYSVGLAKYFRETSHHYKAYGYTLKGMSIPQPNDSLFVETNVYSGLFEYEKTILDFYVGRLEDGLITSMVYLLKRTENLTNVYTNMGFYVEPLKLPLRNHPIDREAAGGDYHPTSVSTVVHRGRTLQNVRFVNYIIDRRNGSYTMKEGTYSDSHLVRTQNVFWDGETATLMRDASVVLPRREVRIRGLEDLRLYTDAAGTLRFLATSSEYSGTISQIAGVYDIESQGYTDCRVIASPTKAGCEKNWIPVSGTDSIVYRWSPLEVGHLDGTELVIETRHTTPWFFQHLRGSASPVSIGAELLFLVHYVEYTQPRKYYHCVVSLSATDFKPLRLSLPFVFADKGIEYCIGVSLVGRSLECVVSSWDDNPRVVTLPLSTLRWIGL
jgi:hypothetical protein